MVHVVILPHRAINSRTHERHVPFNLPIIFLDNRVVWKITFPEAKMTSSNVFVCPKPSDIQLTIIENKGNKHIGGCL